MAGTEFLNLNVSGFGINIIPPEIFIGLLEDNDPGDRESGDRAFPLFHGVPVGSHVDPSLSVTVTGRPFRGTLDHLAGAKVTESPVVYGGNGAPGGTGKAYIVDFGVSLSVLELHMIDPDRSGVPGITLVLPWLGTDFSPKAVFGAQPDNPPLPVPTNGSVTVGLPGIESTKLLVQVDGTTLTADTFATHCRINLATFPTNVRASLNGRLPFWTKPGPLRNPQTAAGFVQDLNTLLASLTAPADVILQLTADVPGVLGIGEWNPPPGGVVHTAAARWGGQATTQVALTALEPVPVTIPFPVGSPALVTDLSLRQGGAFPPWRSYPAQATGAPGDLGLRVDANFSVARRLELGGAASVYGVTLAIRTPPADAQLHLEIQPEAGGLPASGKPISAADVAVAGAAGGAVAWTQVLFAAPAAIADGKTVWVVVKAKTGTAEWVAAPEPSASATHTVVATEGGAWDDYPPVSGGSPVAQLRVLRRPFPAENTPLLDLAWTSPPGPTVQADVGTTTAAASLQAPADGAPALVPAGGNVTVVVTITARSTGTLSIKGATLAYQDPGP